MRVPLPGLFVLVAMSASVLPRGARAQAPTPELMARLADFASHFETLRTRSTYVVKGHYETLDSSGNADSVKRMEARVEPNGDNPRLEVLSYSEDGEDKTEQARKDARERAEKQQRDPERKRFRIPILADEQPRYVFDQVEVDARDPSRVLISFVPKARAGDTIEGSAWVDTRTGALISAGFKLSKTPIFVDYVHITVEFGATTPLGPAVSSVSVDGKTGLLFLRKHFRVAATLGDYRIPQ